jgi:hypothetical protein
MNISAAKYPMHPVLAQPAIKKAKIQKLIMSLKNSTGLAESKDVEPRG